MPKSTSMRVRSHGKNANEVIESWLEVAIEDGMAVPEPRRLATHQRKRESKGWTWGLVTTQRGERWADVIRRGVASPRHLMLGFFQDRLPRHLPDSRYSVASRNACTVMKRALRFRSRKNECVPSGSTVRRRLEASVSKGNSAFA